MNEQIQRIEGKILQLLKKYHLAQKEILRLQKENERLNKQLQNSKAAILAAKPDTLKSYAGALTAETKKELDKHIDTYLKDIDKCLALLHS